MEEVLLGKGNEETRPVSYFFENAVGKKRYIRVIILYVIGNESLKEDSIVIFQFFIFKDFICVIFDY
jgi:hypothetical protein